MPSSVLTGPATRTEENERAIRVRTRVVRKPPMGWHSINCICADCLDTDMAIVQYGGGVFYKFDLKGLHK